jgi:hypothetical protein
MLEFFNEFSKSRFSSPGTPKMYWTPSFSNAFTNKSDAFISLARDFLSLGTLLVIGNPYWSGSELEIKKVHF